MADGSLIFDTKMDTEGIEKGTNTLKGRLGSVLSSLGKTGNEIGKTFNGTSSSIMRVESSIKTTEQAMEKLSSEMSAFASKQIPTDEYAEIKKQLDDTTHKYDLLKEKQDKFLAIGGKSDSKAFKGMQYDLEQLSGTIGSVQGELDDLVNKGKAFKLGEDTKEYSDLQAKYLELADKAEMYRQRLEELETQQKKTSGSSKRMNSSMKETSKATIPLTKSILKLSNMFKLMLLRMAMRGVINAVKDGFQNLAQYSKQTNKDISALKTSMQTLKNSFATAFAPILTAVTPALKTLIGYLSQAITTVGQFFAVFLTGATTFTKAKDAQIDYAASLKKSSKESKKALASIDELNTLSQNDSSGGYEGPSPAQMFEDVDIDSKLLDKVGALKELLEPVIAALGRLKKAFDPFAQNVGAGLKWFYSNVLVPLSKWTITKLIPGFLDLLGGAISLLNALLITFQPYALWLWDNFLQPLASWTGGIIIEVLSLITDGLYKLSDWIINNQDALVTGALIIGSFFAAFAIAEFLISAAPFIGMLGELIFSSGLLSTILASVLSVLSALSSPIVILTAILGLLIYSFIDLYRNSESFRKSLAELGATWIDALKPLADFIGTVLVDAWEKMLKPVIDFFINTLLPNLIDTFKNLWENVLVPLGIFIGTILQPIFKILADLLMSLWKNVILPLADAVGGVLKAAWDMIYQILNKTIIPIVKVVIDVLQFLLAKVINPIIKVLWDNLKPAFDTVFKFIGDVITGFKEILVGIIKFVTGVFTGNWKMAWEGVKGIFKGIFDALVGIVKAPINLIIDIINGMVGGIVSGINAVINAVNKLSFTMPDWLGGGTVGFNIPTVTAPKIPKLATGTVVPANYGNFMAILGDNKREPEVVSPLSTMEQAMENVLNRHGGAGGADIILNVFLEGKQIYSEVVNQDRLEIARTGSSRLARA